jgi:hypothetical protein
MPRGKYHPGNIPELIILFSWWAQFTSIKSLKWLWKTRDELRERGNRDIPTAPPANIKRVISYFISYFTEQGVLFDVKRHDNLLNNMFPTLRYTTVHFNNPIYSSALEKGIFRPQVITDHCRKLAECSIRARFHYMYCCCTAHQVPYNTHLRSFRARE